MNNLPYIVIIGIYSCSVDENKPISNNSHQQNKKALRGRF